MEDKIFSLYLIKFFEKEDWANNFLNGKLYINQAGKFINGKDNFRGDEYEGCQVTNFQDIQFMRLENIAKGEAVQFPLAPNSIIKQSFVGVDKVPVFCASGLNKNNFKKIAVNKYQFDPEYITYMKKFGMYAVMFDRMEFLNKVFAKLKDIPTISDDVRYQNYDTKIKHFETAKEQYEQFFYKYISDDRDYNKQNEWRLVVCDTSLIDKENDHLEIDIGKLQYAQKIDVEMLVGGIFSIHE